MTIREIVKTFKEPYGADASPSLISKVTDHTTEQETSRTAAHPITHLDCTALKTRQDSAPLTLP